MRILDLVRERMPANFYDRIMLSPRWTSRYEQSDFFNYGYWTPQTTTLREACENLLDKLLAFIPEKRGTILDVACGLGATTRHLLRYYRPADVVAINLSRVQLARARLNAPGATFLLMDATRLAFPDASFDNVLCVEAAFHFDTRDQFFHEAYRVLKPGGRLVHCDILFTRGTLARRVMRVPTANYLDNPEAFRERLAAAGFRDIQVLDATEECWGGWRDYLSRFPRQERRAGRLDLSTYLSDSFRAWLWRRFLSRIVRCYVIAAGQKPADRRA